MHIHNLFSWKSFNKMTLANTSPISIESDNFSRSTTVAQSICSTDSFSPRSDGSSSDFFSPRSDESSSDSFSPRSDESSSDLKSDSAVTYKIPRGRVRVVDFVLQEDVERRLERERKLQKQGLEYMLSDRFNGFICTDVDISLQTRQAPGSILLNFRTIGSRIETWELGLNDRNIEVIIGRNVTTITLFHPDGRTTEVACNFQLSDRCTDEQIDDLLFTSEKAFGVWHSFVSKCIFQILDTDSKLPML